MRRALLLCAAQLFMCLGVLGDMAAADELPDDAHISVGPGIYLTPSYPGARSTRSVPIPFIDAEYGNNLYSSAEDILGVYAYKSASTQVGAALEYDLTERLSRDDERFRHLRNIAEIERFKLFGTRTVSFITGDTSVATDVAARRQGTLAQANLWASMPLIPKTMISVGPGINWADTRYMHTFFGVTDFQAAVSPLTPYVARAGLVDFHWNGLETYELSSRWSVGASEYAARLHGTAVDSPVTQRRAQTTVLAWLAYKVK